MESEEFPTEWHQQRTYDSLLTYGLSAIKFVLFVNGGAILSTLTFLGNRADITASLLCALIWFVSGVVAGGLVHATAYLTQFTLFNERDNEHPPWYRNHMKWLYLSMFLILVGISCFAIGAFTAVSALS